VCGGQDALLHTLTLSTNSTSNSSGVAGIEPSGLPSIQHNHWVTALLTTRLGDSNTQITISGCMDNNIYLFDTITGEKLGVLEGHTKGVVSLCLASGPGGENWLASGSWDGTARLWDLQTHQCIHQLGPHENGVHALYLGDGRLATVRCLNYS